MLGFPYSLDRILGTNFETVRTALIVGTVVQLYGFLVQKSRSKATGMSR
jgi:primosomal replication protein N